MFISVVACTFYIAYVTYKTTPDIENFRAFSEPGSSRFDSKIAYLFGPFFLQIGVFIYSIYLYVRNRVSMLRMGTGLLIMAFFLLVATMAQTGSAERATMREDWEHLQP
jgi:hypothetical protein